MNTAGWCVDVELATNLCAVDWTITITDWLSWKVANG